MLRIGRPRQPYSSAPVPLSLQEVKWHAGDDAALERLDLWQQPAGGPGAERAVRLAAQPPACWAAGTGWRSTTWRASGGRRALLGCGMCGGATGGRRSLAGPLQPRRTTHQLARPCLRRHNFDSCLSALRAAAARTTAASSSGAICGGSCGRACCCWRWRRGLMGRARAHQAELAVAGVGCQPP